RQPSRPTPQNGIPEPLRIIIESVHYNAAQAHHCRYFSIIIRDGITENGEVTMSPFRGTKK
ncbi:hypothetical protein MM809_38265, partial [Klebsiella pneumoniae]|nr:hypothetical protein [Klebsiella pneumoniae]